MQQRLPFDRDLYGCNHGVPLLNRCAECVQETERMIQEFRQAVSCGELDRDGYSKADRKAAERKPKKVAYGND